MYIIDPNYCTLIDFKLRKPHKFQSILVELIMTKRSNIKIRCIYKHPDNNVDDFYIKYLRPLPQKLSIVKKIHLYLMTLTHFSPVSHTP